LKEWTTPDPRNTPSTTNLEVEEIVDAPGNDGNASMPEQVKRPNPWRKMMMMIKILKWLSSPVRAMEANGKSRGIDEWSTSRPGRFTPGKESWYQTNRRMGDLQCQK